MNISKVRNILLLSLILVLFFAHTSYALINFYPADSSTTGSNALDTVDGNDINNGDGGFVITSSGDFCVYYLDDDINETTSSESPCPKYVQPESNPGTKSWVLSQMNGVSMSFIPVDDPTMHYQPLTSGESEWWAGINNDSDGNDDDPYEVRQNSTPGSSVRYKATPKGEFITYIDVNTPQSKDYSAADDLNQTIGTDLTSTTILVTGSNDSDNCSIDLQDGTLAGQQVLFIGIANIDADDTFTVDVATDSTCLGCPSAGSFTFDDPGDTVELYWTGSAWMYLNSYSVD